MSFLKLLFWLSVSVILAYYMTDIQIGGRTLKENIDIVLHSSWAERVKEKAMDRAEKALEISSSKKESPVPTEKPLLKNDESEGITHDDVDLLKKVIEKNR